MSKTFGTVREEAPTRICGCYALTLAELENRHLPEAGDQSRKPRLPIRCIVTVMIMACIGLIKPGP